jgi:calcineurin-like phosphoesterase family protein
MNEVFVIADTHFGHKKVIEFEREKRPFASIQEHDAELVYRWNNVVRKNDTVWHLGDVLFGRAAFETLGKLNGIKRLVLGNHDHYPSADYLKHFSKLYGAAEYRDCILTHVPINPAQFYRYRLNIHGHMHSSKIDDPRYVCVSVEHTNLQPIRISELLQSPTTGGRP